MSILKILLLYLPFSKPNILSFSQVGQFGLFEKLLEMADYVFCLHKKYPPARLESPVH
jgi:hypothetical protein